MVGILAANSAVSGEYEVSNSLRFNDDDSAYLSRTNSSGGDRQKFTNSFWIKRGNLTGSGIKLFDVGASTSTDSGRFYIGTFGTEKLVVVGGATTYRVTTQVFRDSSAWYHIVVAVDSTDGTADNRVKIYVNGNQVTAFDTNNAMTQNQNTPVNENTKKHEIGRNQQSGSEHYDGYITEWHLIDGQQLSSTDFGEFDDDSGIWKPKAYSGSYGTNGAFLQFKQTGTSQNSSGIGADTSGNDNHFAVTNLAATDVTEDTCTNNFATLNPLDNYWANSTFSEGNCKMVTAGSGYGYPKSTMGVSSGKWYFEAKASSLSGNLFVGIASTTGTGTEQELGYSANDYGYKFTSGAIRTAGSENTYGNSISTSDILGVAFDLDNNKLYFSKNGTYQNSGDPAAGSNGFSITAASSTVSGFYFPSASDINSNLSSTVAFNFGNPTFAISSGNADANGYGNFEYAPPSGYYALCTKNLAEFG